MRGSMLVQRNRRVRLDAFAWIFRTNLPPRRGMPLPNDAQKRNFFGLGEILGVLTNPGETLKSLTEARKSLEEARKEIQESRERAQLRTTHTFAPLPRFFPRPAELHAVERILEGPPAFTVLCGASSVGKTALLREVLSRDAYHVLHFDLRIAGFADLSSLYLSLSKQMEQYFEALSKMTDGYEDFEKEAWGFKHDRLAVEHLVEANGPNAVKTSDIARLMELFQSSLLHYWEFEPKLSDSSTSSDETKVERPTKKGRDGSGSGEMERSAEKVPVGKDKPPKRVPVIFFDEAHKLPALIQSTEAMKCILDSMLVLTKQDRLCHVVHATSDSFYQTWLRQLNIMQHCKIISIGDCSKAETRAYFMERLLPGVPDELRTRLDFEALYDAFGGKLVHWADYVTDFVNANGDLTVKKSSHFLQAYALLNLQMVHTSDLACGDSESQHAGRPSSPPPSGFKIYSPLSAETVFGPGGSTQVGSGGDAAASGPDAAPAFTALHLLRVMRRLAARGTHYVPYFPLCRALGVRAVDDMVRARILELRWTDTVTPEWAPEPRVQDSVLGSDGGWSGPVPRVGTGAGAVGTGRIREWNNLKTNRVSDAESDVEALGPKLLPTTPIMRYAMREVLKEYEVIGEEDLESDPDVVREVSGGNRASRVLADDRSDYASLSDVDEY